MKRTRLPENNPDNCSECVAVWNQFTGNPVDPKKVERLSDM